MSVIVVHVNDPIAGAYALGPIVYIGRRVMRASNPIAHVESPWHNAARIGAPLPGGRLLDRDGSLAKFDEWFHDETDDGTPYRHRAAWCREHVHELKDACLVCWCAEPGLPLTVRDHTVCHGQILGRAVAELGA